MATYDSPKMSAGSQPRSNTGLTQIDATITLAGALLLNDILRFFKIPKGARVIDSVLTSTALDTNGTPLLTMDIGDATVQDRFGTGITTFRAGGVTRAFMVLSATKGLSWTYAADDVVQAKVTAAPATGAAGSIWCSMIYTFQG